MKPGDTCTLVTDHAIPADLVAQWRDDRAAEGWKPDAFISPTTAAELQAELAITKPSHTLLMGDSIPFQTIWGSPDGHPVRDIEADYLYVYPWNGAIGRVYFANQPVTGKPSSQIYAEYLAKRHLWQSKQMDLPLAVSNVDYLSGPLYPYYEQMIQAMRQAIPWGLLEERYGSPTLATSVPNVDNNIERWGVSGRLFAMVFAGGYPSYPPGGFYYVGGPDRWQAADPKIGIFGAFGSYACQLRALNSFLTNTLTGSTTVVAFYNEAARLPVWQMLTTGATAGEVGRQNAGETYTNVLGDPTIMLTQPLLTAAQVMALVAGFDARLTAVEHGTPTVPPVVPAGGIVIVYAHNRQVAHPEIFRDDTALVQQLANTGVPFAVWPGLQPDPFPGVVKELAVSWTNNGVAKSQVFGQLDKVIL